MNPLDRLIPAGTSDLIAANTAAQNRLAAAIEAAVALGERALERGAES